MDLPLFQTLKACTKCGKMWPATAEYFQPRKDSPDGLRMYCYECLKSYNQEKYRRKAQHYKEQVRAHRMKLGLAYNEQQRAWRQARIDEKRQWERQYREKNRQRHRDNDKRYKDSLTGIRRALYHLRSSIGTVIRRRLRGQKNGRKIEELTGWTMNQLIWHLEALFERGMSWDTYGNKEGQWSIDHIRPISSFNIQVLGDEDFRRCWALCNLRPMWHVENCRKQNKIPEGDLCGLSY